MKAPVKLPLKLCGRGFDSWVEDANGVEVIAHTYGFKTDADHKAWLRWVVSAANTTLQNATDAQQVRKTGRGCCNAFTMF